MPRSVPHFKIICSIMNHPKTAALFGDNDALAMYVRLGVLAIERFADRTDDSFMIHDRELSLITGRRRADISRKSLRHLADISPISVERLGDVWRITFPNLARRQGFMSKNGEKHAPPSSSPSNSTSSSEKKEKEKDSSPVPGSLGLVVQESQSPIEKLWNDVNSTLQAYMPRNTGLTLSDARRKRMLKVEKDFGDGSAVAALNGYAAIHLTKAPDGDFDPPRNFNPETCWGPKKIAKYIDADRVARDSGLIPPYGPPSPLDTKRTQISQILEHVGNI